MIDRETVERIKEAAGIVDVVGDYVQLTRRGANYMGLCPFHNERTPSFSVNPRRNFCYCFSCHKGGSPVNFIMEKEGISYHDALLQLAAKYGIEVNERELSDEERERQNARESMFTANKWVMERFESNLTDTPEGRDIGLQYFYQRGLTDEAIRAFHLGYAIDRGDSIVNDARRAGYDAETLVTLGVLGRSQQGDRLYDRFRGRVIFPVFTTSGKVVAFGGRTLKKEDKAKYINSPESPIYRKSNELYGIYQAKSAISKADKCFLVEGYMDVIGMWQSGMQNVVASSGTALTDGQIAAIHRFTSNVTLLYDGDDAGIHAALRGIDMLLANRMNVKVLLLPDGHDPDSFARKHTPEEFRRYVEEHETDIIRFKTKVLLEQSAGDPQRRTAAIRSIVTSLACIPDNIARNVYIGECARQLGVSEEVVALETRRAREQAVTSARRSREYSHTEPPVSGPTAPSSPTQPTAATPGMQPPAERPDRATTRLRQCERQVLTYCVRYGLLQFGDAYNDAGTPVEVTIHSYVQSETEADGITFSVPEYARVFEEIRALHEPFAEALAAYDASIAPGYEQELRQQMETMTDTSMSLEDLQAQERNITAAIDERHNNDLLEFALSWPAGQLASHEDDTVRRIATEMLSQPYHLSRVYSRQGQHIPEEWERLGELVPRAIEEWKDAVLMLRIQSLRQELNRAAANGDTEAMLSLQTQLADMLRFRSEVAKRIGDRIISAT